MAGKLATKKRPLSAAIICFLADYGHLQPLLKIADALSEDGFEINCYIAEECAPLMGRFQHKYVTLVKSDWLERRNSLSRIFGRGILFNSLCLYIHYLTLFPAVCEAIGHAAKKLQQALVEQGPDVIICDGLWFVDWYSQIASQTGIPVLVNSFDGSLAYNQRDFVRVYGLKSASPIIRTSFGIFSRLAKKLCTYFYRIRYFHLWVSLRSTRRRAKAKFDAAFPVSQAASGPVKWMVVGTAPIERERLGGLVRVTGANWPEFAPLKFRTQALLPHELREWLEHDVQTPTIYVSFGSAVELQAEFVTAVYEGLRAVSARVLWSLPTAQQALLSSVPPADHVRLESFVPQAEILDFPGIRCFITQAGPHSVQEAFFGGTPMLCIPYFVDQAYNSSLVELFGVGIKLWRKQVSAQSICTAVQELLTNEAYLDAAMHLKRDLLKRDSGEQIARFVREFLGAQRQEAHDYIRSP